VKSSALNPTDLIKLVSASRTHASSSTIEISGLFRFFRHVLSLVPNLARTLGDGRIYYNYTVV
jgi:hypothetical protein